MCTSEATSISNDRRSSEVLEATSTCLKNIESIAARSISAIAPCKGLGIVDFLKDKNFLITGATGFVAKVLIEKILRMQPGIGKLFLIIRAEDSASALKRLKNEVMNAELFKCLREAYGDEFEKFMLKRLVPVAGDMTKHNLGIEEDMTHVLMEEVDIIVSSAATTTFDERSNLPLIQRTIGNGIRSNLPLIQRTIVSREDWYDVALETNTTGVYRLLEFGKCCKNATLLIHLSTGVAFYNEIIHMYHFSENGELRQHLQIDAHTGSVNECCERLAYYGINTNLVTYLTKMLHQGNATAAKNVTIWSGTCYLTPLLGAILADAYWGRYWTIAAFSTIYFMGMATWTLSTSISSLKPPPCTESDCPTANTVQYGVFYLGLSLIALGTGGIKPCVSSLGADQFDDTDPKEKKKKCSFFNWFYFSIYVGALVSCSILVWIQDNVGWGWGFGIPTVFMGLAIGSFFFGTPLYRFQKPGGSPLTRMCQVVVASLRKSQKKMPLDHSLLYEVQDRNSAIQGSRKLEHTDEFMCLDKAAVTADDDIRKGGFSNPWMLCTVTQVEELKILLRMFPIWASGIVFAAVYAQVSTMFLEQGMT